jgi:anaerobic magnesium-protoporphyrin IX monomethyl ester cyclase
MRWRAERWIKLRHLPAALLHDPAYVLRNAQRMFLHTFRGSTLRTFLGLEAQRRAFLRYCALRDAERVYL